MPSSSPLLFGPLGERLIGQKDVIPVADKRELTLFAGLHDLCYKHSLQITCVKCMKPVLGANNDTPGSTLAIACGCREWRFVRSGV